MAASGTTPPVPVLARVRDPLLVGAGVVAAVALVALRDPHTSGSYGICPSLLLTGFWCAGCGGLRATYDLVHGDLAGAWGMNPLWVALVPVLLVGWATWFARHARGAPTRSPTARAARRWLPWTVLATAVLFTVARNVPALAPWLAP